MQLAEAEAVLTCTRTALSGRGDAREWVRPPTTRRDDDAEGALERSRTRWREARKPFAGGGSAGTQLAGLPEEGARGDGAVGVWAVRWIKKECRLQAPGLRWRITHLSRKAMSASDAAPFVLVDLSEPLICASCAEKCTSPWGRAVGARATGEHR